MFFPWKPPIICFLAFLGMQNYSWCQHYSQRQLSQISILDDAISKYHVDFEARQKSIKEFMPSLFMQQLDPRNMCFVRKDSQLVAKEITTMNVTSPQDIQTFLNRINLLMEERYTELLELLSTSPSIDFTKGDSLYISTNGSKTLMHQVDDLIMKWNRVIKFRVLKNLVSIDDSTFLNQEAIQARMPSLIEKVIETTICEVEQQREKISERVFDAYIKAYALAFDPHTQFFPVGENEHFMSSLSSFEYGTGLVFERTHKGYVITNILPNSSASKETEIRIGDLLDAVIINY